MPEPTKAETDFAFERLTQALKDHGPVPTKKGKPREAKVSEFMYMGQEKTGAFSFKHGDSRNYVFVLPTGKLEIPKGGSFTGGTFDVFESDLGEFARLSTLQGERAQSLSEAAAFPWHVPAEAAQLTVDVLLALHKFKAAFDRVEEIPKDLQPLYDQTMKALAEQDRLAKEVHQLREMAKRSFDKYR